MDLIVWSYGQIKRPTDPKNKKEKASHNRVYSLRTLIDYNNSEIEKEEEK